MSEAGNVPRLAAGPVNGSSLLLIFTRAIEGINGFKTVIYLGC